MRLYVQCQYCRNKIYINSPAQLRGELPFQFVLRCQQIGCSVYGRDAFYTRNEVFAETNVGGAVSGAIVLGALGALVAGPIGAVIGGLIGSKAGSNTDELDRKAVERFNSSW
ncbi:MAG: hypothetical protein OIN84_02060 [Candidatus Methanoperedens sp.]|uniref:hypothetical protein n=1 Tax=Candidatus Methanoperedens sp. BLZ2 TaxID=2035255 RepID=UPI000BE3DB84|nr:hypothetical protein [Candidatus Methanoperedens sp. BLZ2]KAB2946262.1 MAG: hypothetical protein F9K14_07990 [Candidatus Methanoperedens sp.]MBZ0176013.1 hypothetical protein [Candidatus Methanoperedens nitroreducens]MCX9076741.1 hypothetical protein [Candidatus Methanoperedens sp.]